MRHFLLPIALLLLLASCKKSDDTIAGSGDSYGDPLVSENTGWTRIATIKYSAKYVDAQIVPHQMTAYDITANGGALQVLYSEDKFENGDRFPFYFKATIPLSGGSDAVSTELTKMPAATLFRPGTYDAETYKLTTVGNGYHFSLIDEAAKEITSTNPAGTIDLRIHMRPNGDILMGGLYSLAALHMLYYNRAANIWTLNLQSNADTEANIAYTPFMVDGDPAQLAFRLYSLHTKAYMSVAEFLPNTQYPAPPYSTRFKEEHPEYAPTSLNGFMPVYPGTASLVAYTEEGTSLTVVLAYKNTATGSYTLSAYKWTKGATAFQTLYKDVSVSAGLGEKLAAGIIGRCTPDGTVYALIDENSPTNNGRAYHLSLTNGSGEKTYGLVYSNSTRYIAVVSTLRYINGSYYAAVTPMFSGVDYEGQHMDIVKLTP